MIVYGLLARTRGMYWALWFSAAVAVMDLSPGGADRAETGLARPAGPASFSRHRASAIWGPRRLPILPGNRRDMHGVRGEAFWAGMRGMPQAWSCHAVAARRPQDLQVYCAYNGFRGFVRAFRPLWHPLNGSPCRGRFSCIVSRELTGQGEGIYVYGLSTLSTSICSGVIRPVRRRALYESYLDNPGSVPDNWREYSTSCSTRPATDGQEATRDQAHAPSESFAQRARANAPCAARRRARPVGGSPSRCR